MLRIAIVEDDAGCAATLKGQIEQYARAYDDKIVVYTFRDAVNFLQSFRKECYEAVFMDIEMPMMDGVEASKRLREIDATVMLAFVSRLQHLIGEGYAGHLRHTHLAEGRVRRRHRPRRSAGTGRCLDDLLLCKEN